VVQHFADYISLQLRKLDPLHLGKISDVPVITIWVSTRTRNSLISHDNTPDFSNAWAIIFARSRQSAYPTPFGFLATAT
jgi:hypothetical protein